MRYERIVYGPEWHDVAEGTATPKRISAFFREKDEIESTAIKLQGMMQAFKMHQAPWQNWIHTRIDELYAKACAWEEQRKNHPRQAGKA